jgi:RTX calcium-binding nonapeptide repeat (4 copies)
MVRISVASGASRRLTRRFAGAVLGCLVPLLALPVTPAGAANTGELTFQSCLGPAAGCTIIASGALADPKGVATSSRGAVYVSGGEGVADFSGGSGFAYGGCVSSDGSGGVCVDAPGSEQLLTFSNGMAVSPSGGALYVAAGALRGFTIVGAVVQLDADAAGRLTWGSCISDDGSGGACADIPEAQPGTSLPMQDPFGMAMSPDGRSLYAAAFNGAVGHFFADPESGQFSWDDCIWEEGRDSTCLGAHGKSLEDVSHVVVAPDGQVYALSGVNAISHFRPDFDGRPSYEGCIADDSLEGACASAASPVLPLLAADAIAAAPDNSLYTVSKDGILAHFTTDSEGRISYQGCVSDSGSGGHCADLPGTGKPLEEAIDVVVSPDGRSLYVTTETSLLSFELSGGQPVFQQCFSNAGVSGCSAVPGVGIKFFDNVAVSSDGSSVYAVGGSPGYLAYFTRAVPSTGGGSGGGGAGGGGPAPGSGGGGAGGGSHPTCDGKQATIVGTRHADHLKGTRHADVIVGLGGDDTIEGLAGNDTICGGEGNDHLIGGPGRDKLFGQAGRDTLIGGPGNDVLVGGPGHDRLKGGAGRNSLR